MTLLEDTIQKITPQDRGWREKARERLERLTMPYWALGRLMDLAVDLAGIMQRLSPPLQQKTVVVMAGDHGVVEEGVSAYPSEVTTQMVRNFVAGGAGINAIARTVGARVVVVDMGVAGDLEDLVKEKKILGRKIARGTPNFTRGPAMSRVEAIRSIEIGIEIANELASQTDLFAVGEMGIGNTTPSTAIAAVVTGLPVPELTGRGTGVDDAGVCRKITAIERALAIHRPHPQDPLDILTKVSGLEIGGIAGLILGAAALRRPIVIDGLISTAGAFLASLFLPAVREYLIAGHRSVEPGHIAMLQGLKLEPLLDLQLRLGEGTGAALAMPLVESASRLLSEVATFEEAGVSGKL